MATCTGNMWLLPSTSYQALRARADAERSLLYLGADGRCGASLRGSSSLGFRPLQGLALKANRGLRVPSTWRDARETCVCTVASGAEHSDRQASQTEPKPKPEGVNSLLKLIPKLLPAIVIGVACWLIRRPNLAFAGVEAPGFAIGGEAAAQAGNGVLSQEIARGGGGLLASAWTGLVAGGLHTLTGPDHLAALAPLCIGRSRLQSFSVGALWGCGHDAGQVIFGIIFLLLKDRLHLGVIQTWAARVVGLTLITIGVMGIKEAQEIEHATPALAEGDVAGGETPGKKSVGPATFITGVVYGLQPDALLMVLPALSLPSRAAGAAFLGTFLLGTVLAMGSYTAFVSSLSQALQKRVPKITHRLTVASSLVAMGLGAAVLLGEVFGINLF